MSRQQRQQTVERRKFRRLEVAWVARLLGVRRGKALRIMDKVYREAERANAKTWCVRSVAKAGQVGVRLGLEMAKDDARVPAGGGLTLGRAYFREA